MCTNTQFLLLCKQCMNTITFCHCFSPSAEDCDAFGDRSTQRGATSESLGVDSPGSSHLARHREELKILIIHEKGEGRLAIDGHDTLFTASEPEARSSLSTEHGVVKSLERGEQLVCREELSVQVGNHLLIHHPKERLPLLQLQHTPLESPHLYEAMSRKWGFTTNLCK